MILVQNCSKRYRKKLVVDDLSFSVGPGAITGFLGPNGSGKSTTMRILLGLTRSSAGTATFDGIPYRRLEKPLHTVGSVLDADAFHPNRSARNHLRSIADTHEISSSTCDSTLEAVGLADAADQFVRKFSLGMRQRLSLASALIGDPETLILDEPMNGLDTEGIRWLRDLLRRCASQGRTILVSSHLMNEMSVLADNFVVINEGRLAAIGSRSDFISAGRTLEDTYSDLTSSAQCRSQEGSNS